MSYLQINQSKERMICAASAFLHGNRHAHGIMVKKQNDHVKYEYEGGWQNDRKSGIGIEYVNEKMIYNGSFLNGKRRGPGTLYDCVDLGRAW